jgi:hypothetical protein
MKEFIKQIPVVGDVAKWLHRTLSPTQPEAFPGSAAYWEQRYVDGGNSGAGSYSIFATFKADVLNEFVKAHDIRSVIEFGSGDGNQLTLADYPEYLGVDVSKAAVAQCRKLFESDPSKSFLVSGDYQGTKADLSLSLDVIYHLVEDEVFDEYMRTLFQAADRYVIVYASNTDDNSDQQGIHVRHRKFTAWVERNLPAWKLVQHIPNRHPYRGDYQTGSFADFFIFEKTS